jgi:hypothetical protein
MGAKILLAAMAAGTALFFVALPDAPAFQPDPDPAAIEEKPWLSREAERQLISGTHPGPLFDEIALAGPAPSKEVRAKIAAFAKQHAVDIDLEVENDTLVAIRLAVTYGGCCGYEGADKLGLRLRRPYTSVCCGCEEQWIDDWALSDEVVHLRVSIRVSRIELRWQRALSAPEVLAQADALLGMSPADLKSLREVSANHEYLLELPLPETGPPDVEPGARLRGRHDLGLVVRLDDGGKIAEVSTMFHELHREQLAAELTRRWGRSADAQIQTWKRADRIVTLDSYPTKLTIVAR